MIKEQLVLYPNAIWVQIIQHRMLLVSSDQHVLATENSPLSFANLGSFAVNYPIAEQHFAQLLQKAHFKWYEFGQPIVFIQLMDRTEPQLDNMELQAIQEMALNANARIVQIFFKNGESLKQQSTPKPTTSFFQLIAVGLVLLSLLIFSTTRSFDW